MAETLNKQELVSLVAETLGSTKKDAKIALEAVVETIRTQLHEGREVNLTGFAKFYPVEVAEKTVFNHLVGREVTTPAHIKIKAKVSKAI